jgi:hypothetical protein
MSLWVVSTLASARRFDPPARSPRPNCRSRRISANLSIIFKHLYNINRSRNLAGRYHGGREPESYISRLAAPVQGGHFFMSFVSKPKALSLPEESFYPIDRLFLFDRHNRRTWEHQFGQQAPPWDKTRQIKRWADTSVLEGVTNPEIHTVVYDYFDPLSRSFGQFKISAREAALPNLPGTYVYPKYVVEPTPAVVVNINIPGGEPQPLNPSNLCQKAEADAIVGQLGTGSVVEADSFVSGAFRIDWRGETRRRWLIKFGMEFHNAAALVLDRNREGIGSPGQWAITPSGPRWVSYTQDTGDQDPRPEIPIPCRLLFEQEALYLAHPMSTLVYRKDKESEYNPGRPALRTGLTEEQAAALSRIDANVQQLLVRDLVSAI